MRTLEELERELERHKTVEEELRRELEAKNELLRHVASAVNHDLREPVRVVRSFSQLTREHLGEREDEALRQYATFIEKGGARMVAMLDGLVRYVRLETQPVEHTRVRLQDVLLGVQNHFQARLEATQGTLHIPEDLPEVLGHERQLALAFEHLVSNALTFTRPEEPPRVEVSWAQDEGSVRVRVKDHGVGIAPLRVPKIFDLFHRAHRDGLYPGDGVGLALVRKVVTLHAGEVFVTSVEGEGTTFEVVLPRVR